LRDEQIEVGPGGGPPASGGLDRHQGRSVDRVETARLPGPPALESQVAAQDRLRRESIGPEELGDVRAVSLQDSLVVLISREEARSVSDIGGGIEDRGAR